MVYVRKDVEDNSETIVKEGQTVTNNDVPQGLRCPKSFASC